MHETKAGEHPTRILVVDDEVAIRRLLTTVLGSNGFAVHQAENGHLGLAAAATVRPDLILLDLEVDLVHRRILLCGREVQLTPTEYDLLRLLVSHAGKVLTHRQILKQIWGVGYIEQPHVLRVNISNLRHKIEKDSSRPRYILTEAGVGYRFKVDF